MQESLPNTNPFVSIAILNNINKLYLCPEIDIMKYTLLSQILFSTGIKFKKSSPLNLTKSYAMLDIDMGSFENPYSSRS